MLSLYFNVRLAKQRLNHDRTDPVWFYPVTFPKRGNEGSVSQYDVLLATLKSYSVLKYHTAIFNLAIDFLDCHIKEEIEKLISENFNVNVIFLKFTRPSTLDEWKQDITEISEQIEKNSPILVVMNHDHPFIDYTPDVFHETVENVFPRKVDNFGKVLPYSHAPEAISSVFNDRTPTRYIKHSGGIYKREVTNRWVVSIWVMTIETLGHILSRATCKGSSYMGRIDWAGVEYDNLTLTTYVFPREFFKHYDGYGHITGMRLISDVDIAKSPALQFPMSSEEKEIIEFYYQRWLDCFLLAIRDTIRTETPSFRSTKSTFIKAIEKSLELFRVGYLEADIAVGLIRECRMCAIEGTLRSHIYYFGNFLFESIRTEILLVDGDFYKYRNLVKKIVPSLFLQYMKKLKQMVSRS